MSVDETLLTAFIRRVTKTPLEKVGARIRRRREALRHSQEGFAQYAGIDRARYGKIERGQMNLTLEKVFHLAAHLSITPHELLLDVTLDDCLGVISGPDDPVGKKRTS